MNFFLLYIIQGISSLSQSPGHLNCNKNDQQIFREKSILRGYYKDVASQSNGGVLSSMRTNYISENISNNISNNIQWSPLRDLDYLKKNEYMGHILVYLHGSIIVEFLQTYEINLIRFWLYDGDTRISYIQIFATGADRTTETLLYQGSAPYGVNTYKFQDQYQNQDSTIKMEIVLMNICQQLRFRHFMLYDRLQKTIIIQIFFTSQHKLQYLSRKSSLV